METSPIFHPFGTSHLVVIFFTIALPLIFAPLARNREGGGLDWVARGILSSLLLVNYLGYAFFIWRHGMFRLEHALPFQLCDWTMFMVIVALLRGDRSSLLGVAYFWGIGGSLQAILTPNLAVGFPSIRFISFFIDHCGIVIGIVYLMISRRFRPTLRSVWRTVIWSEVYFVVTIAINLLTGANYGFLMHKPEAFSILNFLSDSWPLYIVQMHLVAYAFFAVLYLPFLIYDLFQKGNSSHEVHKGAQR